MHTEIVQTEENWLRIRTDWDRLSQGCPMLSFDWLHAWWQAYGNGSRLHIVVVRNDSGLMVGIAPWYECQQVMNPSLRFLGSGKVCSDYLRLMSVTGFQSQVCHEVVASARQRLLKFGAHTFTRGLVLEGLAEDDLETTNLLSSFERTGFLVRKKPLESSWQIALPGTWESMLLRLKKNFRRKARKCIERLDDGTLKAQLVTDSSQLPEAMEILVRLHQARRASMGGSGCFDDPRFAVFLTSALESMIARGTARAVWIESDGKPIAIQVQLIGEKSVFMYQSGFDPSARSLEPGHVIIAHAIRQAIEEGRACYDFLRGDEYYKSAWGAQRTGLLKAWLIPPTIWARSLHYAGEGALALRDAYRHLRKAPDNGQPSIETDIE